MRRSTSSCQSNANPRGNVRVPGAREAGASRLLDDEAFGLFALGQGFVGPTTGRVAELLMRGGGAFRAVVNADLDALAFTRRPGVMFRALPSALREEVVAAAFDDDVHRPAMVFLRAAAFTAFLGAVTTDVGLRALGFPPFEDWDARIAVSGYPRTKAGRRIDVVKEDLAALEAKGDLDDYTYARAPQPDRGVTTSPVCSMPTEI
jgi:hypothetical protein